MAQFDVYRNPAAANAADMPFLLDVQSDLLTGLATRAFVPLVRLEVMPGRPAAVLNPVLEVEGSRYLLLTQELAGIPLKRFKPPVASLAAQREVVLRALDFVVSGF